MAKQKNGSDDLKVDGVNREEVLQTFDAQNKVPTFDSASNGDDVTRIRDGKQANDSTGVEVVEKMSVSKIAFNKLTEENRELKDDIETAIESAKEHALEVSDLREQNGTLEKNLLTANKNLSDLETRVKELEEILKGKGGESKALEDTEMKVLELEETIETMTLTLKDTEKLKTENATTVKNLGNARSELDRQKTENATLLKKIERLETAGQSANRDTTKELSTLRQSVSESKTTISQLKASLATANTNVTNGITKNQKLEIEIKKLKEKLMSLSDDNRSRNESDNTPAPAILKAQYDNFNTVISVLAELIRTKLIPAKPFFDSIDPAMISQLLRLIEGVLSIRTPDLGKMIVSEDAVTIFEAAMAKVPATIDITAAEAFEELIDKLVSGKTVLEPGDVYLRDLIQSEQDIESSFETAPSVVGRKTAALKPEEVNAYEMYMVSKIYETPIGMIKVVDPQSIRRSIPGKNLNEEINGVRVFPMFDGSDTAIVYEVSGDNANVALATLDYGGRVEDSWQAALVPNVIIGPFKAKYMMSYIKYIPEILSARPNKSTPLVDAKDYSVVVKFLDDVCSKMYVTTKKVAPVA